MFFYIKLKYPPITQRQTPFSKLQFLLSPFYSTSPVSRPRPYTAPPPMCLRTHVQTLKDT